MLEIINDLRLFFEDCYRRIGVREYARMRNISPPSASSLLQRYHKEGLLQKEVDRRYHFYFADKESRLFIDLSRMYWRLCFEKAGLLKAIGQDYKLPIVVLFGSLAKAEVTKASDIDIAVFSPSSPKQDVASFEKRLKRPINVIRFSSREKVKNEELLNNILSGYILVGSW